MASYSKDQDDILARLRKIEGQVKGIQKMVESNKYCIDVLNQLSAVVAATRKVNLIILENHIRGCVSDALLRNENSDEHINELITVIEKSNKY